MAGGDVSRPPMGRLLVWVAVALGACLPLAAGQVALQCFPTPEFKSYTREAQDVRVAFSLKAPGKLRSSAPLSLTTVLDRSGSMHGRKMELLQATSKFLVDKLAEDDGTHNTGIVVYGDDVVDLVELQPVTKKIAPLMNQAIDSVFAYGQTFLSGGLKRGLEQQRDGPNDYVKNVFLFTDGLPTIGSTTPEDIMREMEEIRSSVSCNRFGDGGGNFGDGGNNFGDGGNNFGDGGSNFGDGGGNRGDGECGPSISVSTFAVGDEIDVLLLEDIARAGGGQAYIISNEDDIPIAFGDAIGGLLSIVAQDIDIFFKPINGVFMRAIRTGGNVTEFSDGARVSFSNLYVEERRDLILDLSVPSDVEDVVEVQVEYTDAFSLERVLKSGVFIALDRSASPDVFGRQKPKPLVGVTDVKYLAAQAVGEAKAYADAGDLTAAATAIATATATVDAYPYQNDPTIIAIRKDLEAVKRLLEAQGVSFAADGAVVVVPGPPAAPSGSSGVLGRLLGTLADVLRSQRSSAGTSGDEELESSKEADTKAKKKTRRTAQKAVLVEEEAQAPSSRSRREGPEDDGEDDGDNDDEEPQPMIIQSLTADAELVVVPMGAPAPGSEGSGLPPEVAEAIESSAAEAEDDDVDDDDVEDDGVDDDIDDDGVEDDGVDDDDDVERQKGEKGKGKKNKGQKGKKDKGENQEVVEDVDGDSTEDDGIDDDGVDDGTDDDGIDDDGVEDDDIDDDGVDDDGIDDGDVEAQEVAAQSPAVQATETQAADAATLEVEETAVEGPASDWDSSTPAAPSADSPTTSSPVSEVESQAAQEPSVDSAPNPVAGEVTSPTSDDTPAAEPPAQSPKSDEPSEESSESSEPSASSPDSGSNEENSLDSSTEPAAAPAGDSQG